MARSAERRAAALPVALALLGLAGCGGGDARPRNVLLISLDTLRPDHLSCYGHERETSPAIDALAARGVRFEDAVSTAPWTLPAHATMFTGLYPGHHGVKDYSHRLPAETTTLAEALRESGFQTFAVINTWNIANPSFEIFQGFDAEDVHYVREAEQGAGGAQVILNTGPKVADKARELLAARDPARPFLLFAHFYDAHTDFTPAPEYRERFVSPYPTGRLDGSTGQLYALRAAGAKLAEQDLRFLRDMYDAEIRQLDDVVAGLLSWLDEAGLADETLIVLTSDHGEEFQEHGGLLHGRTQYEELLRVPLIFAGPGVPRGEVVEAPVSLIDVAPTILARLGLPPLPRADGVDLAPAWEGGALAPRPLFGEADHNNVVDGKPVIDVKHMVRHGADKLHLDRLTSEARLFDLASDPGELHDLAPASPERVRELRALLERFHSGALRPEASGEVIDDEERELLRGLGYAGDDEPSGDEPADGAPPR